MAPPSFGGRNDEVRRRIRWADIVFPGAERSLLNLEKEA